MSEPSSTIEPGPPQALAVRLGSAVTTALWSPWTTVGLGIAAAIVAAVIQQTIYPAFSWNRDEPVYLWQVELLREGQLSGTDGGFPELFQPWLTAWRDAEFFTQYPLGWPLVILLGALVGWPGAAISIAAALAVTGVVALAFELWHDRLLANVAGLVMLCSPIFAVQGGLYLNYLFTLGLGLWFTALLIGSMRLASPRRAAGAAVAFGWVVCTRPFDAVLWGIAAVGYLAVVERGRWRNHLPTAAWFLVALAPFAVIQLLHNWTLTGAPFTFPITEKDSLDTFGFGFRRIMPSFEPEWYGLRRAVSSTAKHGFFLPWFLFGAYLGVVLAAVTAWVRRRDPGTWLLIAIIALFPAGYFFFWGTYVSSLTVRLSGPIYFVPLYAPLAVLIAAGVVTLARRQARAALATVVVLAVVTVPITTGRLGLNRELSRAQAPWSESIEQLDGPAVVVVAATSYLLFLNPYSANSPDIDGDVIYATNAWPSVIDLLEAHPDRDHYLQRSSIPAEDLLPSESPQRPEIVLDPLEVVEADRVEVVVEMVPPRDGEQVWAYVDLGGRPRWHRLTHDSVAGVPLRTTWTLTTTDAAPGSDDDSTVLALSRGRIMASFGASFGSAPRTNLTPFVFERFHLRITDGVAVLTPGSTLRGRDIDELPFPVRWDEVREATELSVEVRAHPQSGTTRP